MNAEPEFEFADASKIPRPTFSGKFTHSKTVHSEIANISIIGECDKRIESISVRLVNRLEWSSIADLAEGNFDDDCSDGKFSFQMKPLSTLPQWTMGSPQASVVLEARSETVVGSSYASQLNITYLSPKKNLTPGFAISPGSNRSISSNYQLKGSIHFLKNQRSSSSNYQLLGGASQ
jgi:hypothetical protein